MNKVVPSNRLERARKLCSELSSPQQEFKNLLAYVDEDPLILWEPVHAGTTLMHVAARCLRHNQISCLDAGGGVSASMTYPPQQTTMTANDVWLWLLQKACCRVENFLEKQDKAGETCLDCFMSAWVTGRKCLGQTAKSNFSKMVESILLYDYGVDQLRSAIVRSQQQGQQKQVEGHASALSFQQRMILGNSSSSSRDILVVAQIYCAFELLCRVAALGLEGLTDYEKDVNKHQQQQQQHRKDFSIIPFIAQTGRCPAIFARLLVRLFPEQVLSLNNPQDFVPLHYWASASKPSDDESSEGLLISLLEACPEAACCVDRNGRVPLHLALAHNKSLREVQLLWKCSPPSLGSRDPMTGLYPFALAAIAARNELQEVVRGFQKRGPSVKLFEWLDATKDVEMSEKDSSCYLLGSIYDMLRAFPQALQESLG